jgi:hypothetical protein
MSINGTSGLVFNDASTQNTAATGFGFKNRIINGAMVIDQRNAGASVNPVLFGQYTLDRWQIVNSQTSRLTVQQSSVAPTGFTNSALITSSSAYAITSTDYFFIRQRIEGFNVADLGWGTANAQTVTVSFWVRSSLTGTFGGSINNGGDSRGYPFTYTISAANTWEQKSITVAGDTTGTWFTNNNIGLAVNFSVGVGSTFSGTAGAWGSGNLVSATGATSVVGTNGATFYITGVQLEKGSTATSFDYRPYGTELALCQRYFEKSYNTDVALGTATQVSMYATSNSGGSTGYGSSIVFKVTKRATPTMVGWTYTGTLGSWHYGVYGSSEGTQTLSFGNIGSTVTQPFMGSIPTSQNAMYGHWAASAEL